MFYSKTCVKRPLSKRPKIGFQDQLWLNAGWEHSTILSTFIKLPFVIKIFAMSIFEWPFYTGFIVQHPVQAKNLNLNSFIYVLYEQLNLTPKLTCYPYKIV